MNIGLDVDGVLVDVRTFQLREGKRYFEKKFGISIKNPDMFEVQDVFECTKKQREAFWIKYIWKYCLKEPMTDNAALESFDVSPLHYLIKSPKLEKLEEALDRFFDKHAEQNFYVKSREGILALPVSDILFFEIYGHDLSVHLTSGENHTFSGTLKKIEEDLPSSTFIRAHKSYLVNMAHIVKIARYQITLSTGQSVPISKKNYLSIMSAFVDYSTRSLEI